MLGIYYINQINNISDITKEFVLNCQDQKTGLMVGPELEDHFPSDELFHNREHLLLHSTCTAVATCQNFGISLRYPILFAHKFCDLSYLSTWLESRCLQYAWLEGNNLLFVGQLLIYLRDVEKRNGAQAALECWFAWLEKNIDPNTNLWGSNGFCPLKDAVYGGYHQLLAFYHEDRPIINSSGLIDSVLSLQNADGSFDPNGNGGACEDVDAVDILVNMYKRHPYKQAAIRCALWRCVNHILKTQNSDGGFPYRRYAMQSHMGIPGTTAGPNVSTTFPTWFRIHTLALCAEIVPDHPALHGVEFGFSNHLSMGWHRNPEDWSLKVSRNQRYREASISAFHLIRHQAARSRRFIIKLANRMKCAGHLH